MRHEQMPVDIDGDSTGYTFFFQIAHNGGRQACGVKVTVTPSALSIPIAKARTGTAQAEAGNGMKLTPEKRPEDPNLDGTGLRFETMEHGCGAYGCER
jgi:hypothetical protein